MQTNKKILAFAGSTRHESLNKKLLKHGIIAAKKAGLTVTEIDLKDYPMPLFNEDDEMAYGLPDPAKALKKLFIQHDGIMLAAPEYNSSITPLLKNTLDWISRKESAEEADLAAYYGKTAALMSASIGYYGGLRGLVTVRSILSNIGVTVIPEQVCVAQAHDVLPIQDELPPLYQQGVDSLALSLRKHLDVGS